MMQRCNAHETPRTVTEWPSDKCLLRTQRNLEYDDLYNNPCWANACLRPLSHNHNLWSEALVGLKSYLSKVFPIKYFRHTEAARNVFGLDIPEARAETLRHPPPPFVHASHTYIQSSVCICTWSGLALLSVWTLLELCNHCLVCKSGPYTPFCSSMALLLQSLYIQPPVHPLCPLATRKCRLNGHFFPMSEHWLLGTYGCDVWAFGIPPTNTSIAFH